MKRLMGVLLVSMVLAVGNAQGQSPCQSYTDCGQSASGYYGCALGSWMGVTSYSNGGWTGGPCGQWQCVEFVKRFYSNEVGDAITQSWGYASSAYDLGSPSLNKYAQGGTTSPQPGDVLCFDGGTYGHVAIVSEVGTNYVRMIDQNRTSSSSNIDIVLTLTESNDHYTVGTFGSPYYVEGWLRDPDYIPSGVAAKFTDVVNRNGSSAVGSPSSNFYWYGPYVRRNYAGGTFGTCCIMYDPNNARGNPQATNEAYLLRTGFYQYYMNNGGWEAKGCTSRDEYHPETGATGDAIQFFVRRLWNFQKNKYDDPLHYMYFEANLPTNEPPAEVLSWHSQYTTDWVSQLPAGKAGMLPTETKTFIVKFQNTGTTTWYNNAGSYPYDYVCLKSTDPDGNIAVSLLNNPFIEALGWLDAETPCTMQESSVPPGGTATFVFIGEVASSQLPGMMHVYFRPYHSMAGLLDGWDGMHFQVNVVDQVSPNATADLTVLYNYGSCQTRAHLLLSNSYAFEYQGNEGWRILDNYCLDYVVRSVSGDFDGNGVSDVAMLYQYGECSIGIHVLLSTGASFTYEPYWRESDGYCPYAIKGMVAGDFNGDGKDDIATVYDYGNSQVRIHTLLSTGGGFEYQLGNEDWWTSYGYCGYAIKFVSAGDLNADGKDDLVIAYRYGTSSTWLHAFFATESSFVYQGAWFDANGWFSLDAMKFMEMGDVNGDGKCDVVMACRYSSTEMALLTFLSNGSGFNYQGWWYHNVSYSLDAVKYLQVGDINADGKADVAMSYTYGEYSGAIHCFTSSGSGFNYSPFWWQSTSYGWDYTNGFLMGKFDGSGGAPKILADEPQSSLPLTFQGNQNYPNPFNPTTVIAYVLPSATHVSLEVFNVLGQRVTTLVDEQQTAGEHVATWDANDYPSGVYFYRLRAGEATETKKMLLLK